MTIICYLCATLKQKNREMMILPAEWEPQRFVQLTWPHEETDWAPYLKSALECFTHLAEAITRFETLLIVTPEPETVEEQLLRSGKVNMERVVMAECPTNDTWARDHGMICTRKEAGYHEGGGNIVMNDFSFNGWGMKFAANLDNQINRRIWEQGTFEENDSLDLWEAEYNSRLVRVLEGGSVESDGQGTILTTTECLLSANRNYFEHKKQVEKWFAEDFGCNQVLWLDHGFLVGDDTDSHIDTLARLCPGNTIVYVKCTDETDIHYDELKAMEEQLRSFRTPEGLPYRLLALPMASEIKESDFEDAVEEEGDQRLPATYANFLILNGAVLYPTYAQPEQDRKAKEVLEKAFPDREVIGIDCRVLIRQHGSLHCVTMQWPK